MTGLWAIGAIAAAASSVATLGFWLGIRFRQLHSGPQESVTGFSPERYEVMARLLDPREFRFIRGQPCGSSKAAANWYRSRRRIFRLYLRDLAGDFGQLHAVARAAVAESPAESSALVGVLMRQQMTFWLAMAGVEMRLGLHSLGIGQVDARGLIAAIEAMRLEIQSLRPAAVPA